MTVLDAKTISKYNNQSAKDIKRLDMIQFCKSLGAEDPLPDFDTVIDEMTTKAHLANIYTSMRTAELTEDECTFLIQWAERRKPLAIRLLKFEKKMGIK